MIKKVLALCVIIGLVAFDLFGAERSPEWARVRREHLKTNPICAVCGSESDLEVHHIRPFHLFPELELEPENLVTLCKSKYYGFNDHLVVGHGGNYSFYNPWVMDDIKAIKKIREKHVTFSQAETKITKYTLFIMRTVKRYNCKKYGNGCEKRFSK